MSKSLHESNLAFAAAAALIAISAGLVGLLNVDVLLGLAVLLGSLMMIMIVRDWQIGVLALGGILPFAQLFDLDGGGGLSGYKLLTGITLLSFLIPLTLNQSLRQRLIITLYQPPVVLLMALTAWTFLSFFWAYTSTVAVSGALRFLGVLVLMLLVAMLERKYINYLWSILLVSTLLSIPVGVLFTPDQSPLSGTGRFSSSGQDPNEYAGLMLIAAVVVGFGINWKHLNIVKYLVVLGLMVAVLFTGSRAGLVTLLLLPLFIPLLSNSAQRLRTLGMVVAVYLAIGLAGLGLLSYAPSATADLQARYSTLQNYSSDSTWAGRLDIWRGAWVMIQGHPWLGVGAGNFPLLSPQYSNAALVLNIERPNGAVAHNSIISVLSELGIPGLVLFLGFTLAVVRLSYGLSQNAALRLALLIGFLIYFFMAQSLTWEFQKIAYLVAGSLVALTASQPQKETQK